MISWLAQNLIWSAHHTVNLPAQAHANHVQKADVNKLECHVTHAP